MNELALRNLADRRNKIRGNVEKLTFVRSKRDRAFDQLATAMQRGFVSRLTESDIEHAKSAAEKIGGTTQGLVVYFCSATSLDRDEAFRSVAEIVRSHQKGVGARFGESHVLKNAFAGASARLGRIIRKAKNRGDLARIRANLPTRLSEKELRGGGTKAIKFEQNEVARKRQRN